MTKPLRAKEIRHRRLQADRLYVVAGGFYVYIGPEQAQTLIKKLSRAGLSPFLRDGVGSRTVIDYRGAPKEANV